MTLGVHWSTCIYLCLLIALISINTQATYSPDSKYLDDFTKDENQVNKSRWDLYSRLLRLYFKRKNPWLYMDNKGYCYQAPCKQNKDCCTMNNICDKSARVCIDCWYGYPCKSNADCCKRYPVCDKILGEKHGRCSRE